MFLFRNLFLIMSLSGTMVFLLYLLVRPLTERYFSPRWRCWMLRLAMVFYLLQFPYYKYRLWGLIYDRSPAIQEKVKQGLTSVDTSYLIVVDESAIQFSTKLQYLYASMLFIGAVSVILVCRQIHQYRRMKVLCLSEQCRSAGQREEELFSSIKRTLGIKREVRFVHSVHCRSPLTSGVRKPVVIFPEWKKDCPVDPELYGYMITHELAHIKHHDVLIRLIGILVVAVHWFNPFVYLWWDELSCVSEMYCDSVVMEGKGEKERSRYGELFLELAAGNTLSDKNQFVAGLTNSRNKKMYERRILEMKVCRQYKPLLSVVAAMGIGMAGVMTAFAYDPPKTFLNEAGGDTGVVTSVTAGPPAPAESLAADQFFTADDGTIYILTADDEDARVSCVHDYSGSGTSTVHKKDGKGGCIVKTYEALICSKCGSIKTTKLISTLTYESCPH